MSDADDNVVYRYEPRFDGEFFRGVPARDLTQADVDRLDPLVRIDALSPHPLYGVPLYVEAGKPAEPPKWFRALQEKAGEGVVIEPMLAGETEKSYKERTTAPPQPPGTEAAVTLPEDPDAPVGTEPTNEPPVLGEMAGGAPDEDGAA